MSSGCPLGVVAVHLGAGYHSDSPCTNAGTGANLTLGGTVECDAAVMDGHNRLFGALGAVSSLRNPVLAARALLEDQWAGPMTLGLVPPAVLVGRGAERWALQRGFPEADGKQLVTEKSAATYRRYVERLAAAERRRQKHGRGATPRDRQGAGKRARTENWGHGDPNVLQGTAKDGETAQGQGNGNVLQESTKDVAHAPVQGQGDCKGTCTKGEGVFLQGEHHGTFLKNRQNLGGKTRRDGNLWRNGTISDIGCEAEACGSSGIGTGRFDRGEQSLVQSESAVQDRCDADIRLDTVGAVAMDTSGAVSAAVSSGGLALKQPGRLGHAAMFGCGCWAEQRCPLSVACSTTGCGEHVMQAMLAKECAEAALQGDASLDQALKSKFLHSPALRNVERKVGGVLVLRCEEVRGQAGPVAEVMWGHTADSMCVGFMSTRHNKPQVRMSRLPPGQRSGQVVVTEGCLVR
ncbi:taspase, threonine aspartase, 1 [Branchiostoma belcheri]|nr:taspase, threonine aspartase, 1 [Branchiostoma belcheri]